MSLYYMISAKTMGGATVQTLQGPQAAQAAQQGGKANTVKQALGVWVSYCHCTDHVAGVTPGNSFEIKTARPQSPDRLLKAFKPVERGFYSIFNSLVHLSRRSRLFPFANRPFLNLACLPLLSPRCWRGCCLVSKPVRASGFLVANRKPPMSSIRSWLSLRPSIFTAKS